MTIAILYTILTILWVLSVVGAFVLGFWSKGKERTPLEAKPLTEGERKALDKMNKEYDNFLSYNGTPQNAINGE
jgi:hypothetical protein